MDQFNQSCILVFVKYPEKGRTKTRLAAQLSDNIAIELYKKFVLDLLSTLGEFRVPFQICFSPEHPQENFMKWLGNKHAYVPQYGNDIGQRMKNAFIHAFNQNFGRAILIGSDIPNLSGGILSEALLSLQTHDAAIGPACDGGYYLIGFKNGKLFPDAFEGIEWSTGTVFGETLRKLNRPGYLTHQLPELRDIDTRDDLKHLYMDNLKSKFRESKTMAYIIGNEWLHSQLA